MSKGGEVKVKFDILQSLGNLFDAASAKDLSDKLKEVVTANMDKGISPVKGERRFVAYKNPKKYPTKALREQGKKVRPVNLKVSGNLHNSFGHRFSNKTGQEMTFGILKNSVVDNKVLDYAKAHNQGPTNKRFPARQFIPLEGQEFQVSIQKLIKDFISERVRKIIKK